MRSRDFIDARILSKVEYAMQRTDIRSPMEFTALHLGHEINDIAAAAMSEAVESVLLGVRMKRVAVTAVPGVAR